MTGWEKRFALLCATRYLPSDSGNLLRELPIPESSAIPDGSLAQVELPEWSRDLGIGSPARLIVPDHCVVPGEGAAWQRCDWWRALFEYLTCAPEWRVEQHKGPIQSYSTRLPETLRGMHAYAWANRILLFLRRWWAQRNQTDETAVFGPVPDAKIELTHDVDGVSKTGAIRLKQGAFCGFNALRAARQRRWNRSTNHLMQVLRFGFAPADYWQFPAIQALEERYGQRSVFNFYGGPGGWRRGVRRTLLDPAYDVTTPRLAGQLRALIDGGWTVGLHPSFDAWRDASKMRCEKAHMERAAGTDVTTCRQHWLRFSLEHTWRAQEAAGLELDMTFGFNDRPGFRGGSALCAPAWIHSEERPSTTLRTLPLVLMDSHLFDYGALTLEQRRDCIDRVLAELRLVGGEASIVWHQRVFHPDYGWGDDYEYLLSRL